MSNKMVLNVLSIKPWSLIDEKSGEHRQGCTVFVGQEPSDPHSNIIGWEVVKFSAPYEVWERARLLKLSLPSECDVVVGLRTGAGGKAAMEVLDVLVGD